jgi:hypothetical protein
MYIIKKSLSISNTFDFHVVCFRRLNRDICYSKVLHGSKFLQVSATVVP